MISGLCFYEFMQFVQEKPPVLRFGGSCCLCDCVPVARTGSVGSPCPWHPLTDRTVLSARADPAQAWEAAWQVCSSARGASAARHRLAVAAVAQCARTGSLSPPSFLRPVGWCPRGAAAVQSAAEPASSCLLSRLRSSRPSSLFFSVPV